MSFRIILLYRVRIGILTLFVPFRSVPSLVPSPSISFRPSFRPWTYRSVHRSVPEHIVPSLDISFRPQTYRSVPRHRSVPGNIVLSLDISFRPWTYPSVPGHILSSLEISFRPGRILLINLELYELEHKI
jgi:hypothetical protein